MAFVSTALIAATICGCQSFPTHNKPASSDLVGVYVQTKESLENLSDIGSYKDVESKIRIAQDGKIFLTNIPDCWRLGTPKGSFDSSAGHWSLANNDGKWQLEATTGEVFTIELLNSQAPYELALVVGDPDQGRAIIFEKRG